MFLCVQNERVRMLHMHGEESTFSYYKTCGNECHLQHTLMPCDLHSNNFSV